MMGISIDELSLITITDNDMIEKWKLNRQFLYRQPKLEIAINAAKEVNNNIHFKSYKEIVSKDTEKIFNDDFWKKQDAIIIAVDNFETRIYISEKCKYLNIPYFNCGTDGTYGNFEAFIPSKTSPSIYPSTNQ